MYAKFIYIVLLGIIPAQSSYSASRPQLEEKPTLRGANMEVKALDIKKGAKYYDPSILGINLECEGEVRTAQYIEAYFKINSDCIEGENVGEVHAMYYPSKRHVFIEDFCIRGIYRKQKYGTFALCILFHIYRTKCPDVDWFVLMVNKENAVATASL